jgi:YidC/Oxa1 family membrane protein insertase
MIKDMFDTIIARPIFNLLTTIYALLPGHNFGIAIILFTVTVRILLWPILRKQLHNTKAMRALQPELKRIKKEANKDKQLETKMTMDLYKEKGINPFSSIGTAFLQLPILLALFYGITKVIKDPTTIVTNSYPWVQNLPWMQELAGDISKLDLTLLGFIDLTRKAVGDGNIYIPALIIVLVSAAVQFLASKMLMVTGEESRSLKQILADASAGKESDQAEVNAATMKFMVYVIPVMILVTSINFAAALGLYWAVSGGIQYLQQRHILNGDQVELKSMQAVVGTTPVEAEIIPPKPKPKKTGTKKKKRR